ncbi:hypothetical protein ACI7RC_26180 [Brevibacillus sp. B_LB10_24]|uniref:hypothetical protein n=1 Tax=Brevibacillus sp. B_LB10_24 TaxID=3380645 RepID=UPI0038B92DE6
MNVLENKSFYYVTNWDDASRYTQALEAAGIPHSVEDHTQGLPLKEGQLAIVFPDLPVKQFDFVHKLFGGVGDRYPQ